MTINGSRSRGETMKAKTRVFLVDDHPIVRTGLRLLIGQEGDMEVCGEAGSCDEALSDILRLKPDVAVIDVSLEGTSGLDLLRLVQEQIPETRTLILSMHDESLYAERAIRAGARGYLMKQERPEMAVTAIRAVASGEPFLSERMKSQLVKGFMDGRNASPGKNGVERLTDRELEIFQMLGGGRTIRDIAGSLCLSAKTVETHRDHIRQKLGLRHSADVLHHAIRWVTGEGVGARQRDEAAGRTPS